MKNLQNVFKTSLSERAIEELTMVKTALQEKNEFIDQQDTTIRKLTERIKLLEGEMRRAEESLEELQARLGKVNDDTARCGAQPLIEDLVCLLSRYENRKGGYGDIPGEQLASLLEQKYGLNIIEGPVEEIDPVLHHVVEVRSAPAAGACGDVSPAEESARGAASPGEGAQKGAASPGAEESALQSVSQGIPQNEDDAADTRPKRIVQLSKGYRLGGQVIRPLQLRVIRTGPPRGGGSGPEHGFAAENRSSGAAKNPDVTTRDRSLVLVHDRPWGDEPRGAA
jgi:molecular chaperone GrpE (heat shock protein)